MNYHIWCYETKCIDDTQVGDVVLNLVTFHLKVACLLVVVVFRV